MRAIILAAGQGTRLGNLTASTPKCLVKIQDTPILKLQIDQWKGLGIDDCSIVIGAKGDCWTQESYNEIRKICNNVIVNFDNEITQNSFSLYLGLNNSSEEDVIFIDGDIVIESEAADEIVNCSYDNFIVTRLSVDRAEPGNRVESDENKVVKNIGKSLQPNHYPWTIYGGIGKIGKNYLRQMKAILSTGDGKDEDVGYPLKKFAESAELCNLIINNGWININTLADMKHAENMAKIG